ncbi:Uncharacterised protein [Mycobacteroides abscessus]|nr:Uncharacterised protein [Mycobacteroides abscessus]
MAPPSPDQAAAASVISPGRWMAMFLPAQVVGKKMPSLANIGTVKFESSRAAASGWPIPLPSPCGADEETFAPPMLLMRGASWGISRGAGSGGGVGATGSA